MSASRLHEGATLLALATTCASAQGAGFDADTIEWHAPSGCPDRQFAQEALREFVDERAVSDRGATRVRVRLSTGPDGPFHAEIRVNSAEGAGVRRFSGRVCGELAEAAVLVVATMLDPITTTKRLRAPRQQQRGPSEAQPPSVDRVGTRWRVGVHTAGDVGSLPDPSVGVGVVLGIDRGRWHFESETTAWLPRLALTDQDDGSGGEIGLYAGALRGCVDAITSRAGDVGVGPCVATELGASTGRGVNISRPDRSGGFWGAGLLGLSARQTSGSLAAGVALEMGYVFARPQYVIENLGDVFRSSSVIGRASLNMAWIFP